MVAPGLLSSRSMRLRRFFPVALVAAAVAVGPAVHGVDNCQKIHDDSLKFFHAFPEEIGSKAAAERLAVETQNIIQSCQEYLGECAKQPDSKPEQVSAVELVLAKSLYVMFERVRMEAWQAAKTEGYEDIATETNRRLLLFLGEVHSLCRASIERLPDDHELKPLAMSLLGFSLHKAGQLGYAGKPFLGEAEIAYKAFLAKFPDDKHAHRIVNGLGKAYLDMHQYDLGTALLNEALEEHYATDSYPYFVETLRKLALGKGDLGGFERAVDIGRMVFPMKLTKSQKLPRRLRRAFERYVHYYGFWKGYARMAAGDFDGAKREYTAHIESLNDQEKELQKQGQKLQPEFAIYRGRSDISLSFLNEFAGKPAPRELDLAWIEDSESILLSDSLGSVTGIVFRGVNDDRSRPFMTELSRLCKADPELQMVAVHYRRKGENVERRTLELREEVAEFGYQGAVGFDPDIDGQQIFRAYRAKVGSASFVIADRTGNLVWFMEDPKELDVRFIHAVMKRIAESG